MHQVWLDAGSFYKQLPLQLLVPCQLIIHPHHHHVASSHEDICNLGIRLSFAGYCHGTAVLRQLGDRVEGALPF